MNYSEYTADELRQIIINSGFPEGANIKGKTNLAEFIENNIPRDKLKLESNVFSDVEFEDEITTLDNYPVNEEENINNTKSNDIPKYNSQEWSDYIIGLLGPDEVDTNGHPLLPGLRRLAEELLGEVIFSGPVSTSYNIVDDNPSASCIYELQILWRNEVAKYIEDKYLVTKTFRAAGDCCVRNADDPWNLFATAIAESRAEARTYRKALGLRVVTGEELSKKIQIEKSERITKNQLSFIKSKIKSLSLKENFSEFELGKTLEQCTQDDGKSLIKIVNRYQENIKEIPEQVRK